MKISIRASPVFRLAFDRTTAVLLKRLSDMHYDDTCNSMNREGGYLFNLVSMLDFFKAEPTQSRDLDWRQMDIILKILEIATWPGACETKEQVTLATNLAIALRKSMHMSEEATYKIALNLEFPL